MEFKSEPVSVDEDRISKLPDDIIISILEKVNIKTTIRTSILSTRWRNLPLLLSHICIQAEDFIQQNSTEVSYELIDVAMASLVELLTNLVAVPKRERCVTTLTLAARLIDNHMCNIGKLIVDAIDRGKLNNLEFEITTVKGLACSDRSDMRQHAQSLVSFFDSSPQVFRYLTKLCLSNASFKETEMHTLLISCEQLQDLTLIKCDIGYFKPLKIDVPHSKLRVLRLSACSFERVQLACLPKLSQLHCEYWSCKTCPVALNYVPRLEEVKLSCDATSDIEKFKITELLGDATNTQVLTLDFHGEKIWIEREGKELPTSFKAIRKLFLHGIYVGFDLLWTLVLLQAAPSIQIFGIEIWDHTCDELLNRKEVYSGRTIGSFDVTELGDSPSCLHLKRLEFGGFKHIQEHLDFIRAVMDHAPNLETIILEDKVKCEECEAIEVSMFPKNKDEEGIVVKKLRDDGRSCPVEIIFSTDCHGVVTTLSSLMMKPFCNKNNVVKK